MVQQISNTPLTAHVVASSKQGLGIVLACYPGQHRSRRHLSSRRRNSSSNMLRVKGAVPFWVVYDTP